MVNYNLRAAQQTFEEAAEHADEARTILSGLLAESCELRAAVVEGEAELRAAIMAVYELPQLLSHLATGVALRFDGFAFDPEALLALLCAFRLRITSVAYADDQPALSAVFRHAEHAAGPVLALISAGLNN